MNLNSVRTSTKGFTLLEMVAVLVLILVLAGLAIPTYQAVIGESRQDAAVLSAEALRNYSDAWAATQQIAPAEFPASFYDTMCQELNGCGNGSVGLTSGGGTTVLLLDFGSDDKCATITWSGVVGGSSTVAASDCSAFAASTATTVCTGSTTEVSITWDLNTFVFADGWSIDFVNWSAGAPQYDASFGSDFCGHTPTTASNSDVDGGSEGWLIQLEAGGTVYSTMTVLTGDGTPGHTYNVFPDSFTGSGSLNVRLVPGNWTGAAWEPIAGQTPQQIGSLSFAPVAVAGPWVNATISGTITGTDGACSGVSLGLFDGTSTQVASATTDGSGNYSITFTDAMGSAGTYYLIKLDWYVADGNTFLFGQNGNSANVASGATISGVDLTHGSRTCS